MNFWDQNYALFTQPNSARQSAVTIADLTKKLDWLYFDRVSPFMVRTYVEKEIRIEPKQTGSCLDGTKLIGIESTKRTVTHSDGIIMHRSTYQQDQRIQIGSTKKTVRVLSNYDKMNADIRRKLKWFPITKLMAYMEKRGH